LPFIQTELLTQVAHLTQELPLTTAALMRILLDRPGLSEAYRRAIAALVEQADQEA